MAYEPSLQQGPLTGDATSTLLGAVTFPTVNTNVGTFALASVTVNGKGLITACSAGSAGAGTVTSVSVASANGFTGTVATATSTPAITVTTSITGVLKGNGTAISAAVAGTDYAVPYSVVSYSTGPQTAVNGQIILCSATLTINLPAAAVGSQVTVKNTGAGTVTIHQAAGNIDGSASNLVTAIQYQSFTLVSDGTNWYQV